MAPVPWLVLGSYSCALAAGRRAGPSASAVPRPRTHHPASLASGTVVHGVTGPLGAQTRRHAWRWRLVSAFPERAELGGGRGGPSLLSQAFAGYRAAHLPLYPDVTHSLIQRFPPTLKRFHVHGVVRGTTLARTDLCYFP